MLGRCSPLFEHAPYALLGITLVGAMTAFFAATTGVVQNDLKRVIAYSTCSQLGYMIFVCGLSQYAVGIFHLMNHAFFKALLFLSAGAVIHALGDEQDMRKMGGVLKLLPFTYSMMVIGSLALIGFPFLTGFYSKDVILEVAYAKYSIGGNFAYWLGVMSALCTSYYSFRLLFLTFVGPVNALKASLHAVHEAPLCMAMPLMLLALGSLFVGYSAKDMLIGAGTPFWNNAIFTLPSNTLLVESEYIPQSIKGIPIVCSALGASAALIITSEGSQLAHMLKTNEYGRRLYVFLNKRWLFDTASNSTLGKTTLALGYDVSFKALDKGFIEVLGPSGLMQVCVRTMAMLQTVHSGYIYQYALLMLVGLSCVTSLWAFWDVLSLYVDSRLYALLVVSMLFYTGNSEQR
jgi:NADH-ubiquinone oxidoreductase chain 5